MDIRGAVQAGADGDVERLVQDAAQFRGRQRLALETDRADAAGVVAVAVAAWDYGDRAGLLIVTDQSVRVDTVRHPCALGWISDGELRLN